MGDFGANENSHMESDTVSHSVEFFSIMGVVRVRRNETDRYYYHTIIYLFKVFIVSRGPNYFPLCFHTFFSLLRQYWIVLPYDTIFFPNCPVLPTNAHEATFVSALKQFC